MKPLIPDSSTQLVQQQPESTESVPILTPALWLTRRRGGRGIGIVFSALSAAPRAGMPEAKNPKTPGKPTVVRYPR